MAHKNCNLNAAKTAKNDEFYTQLTDIEKELRHYKKHFTGKTVFCNCDDPTWSEFWRYFHLNFQELGLKKLISTHYDAHASTYKLEYMGGDDANIEAGIKTALSGNGDFRSEECIDLLQDSDIVVTNPPFSLFRSFLAQLLQYQKQFVIIGNMNAIKYKDVFPLIATNHLWLGNNIVRSFKQPDGTIKQFGKVCWYTNLDIAKRHEHLILWKTYNPQEYPKYDTYDAIEVSRVENIPKDYDGVMGVPISFINKYSPEQFEIIGELNHGCDNTFDLAKPIINGKELFPRIIIRKVVEKYGV